MPTTRPDLKLLKAAVMRLVKVPGFKCDTPDATTGLTCIGRIEGYPQDVVFIVPPSYTPHDNAKTGEDADIVLHLHGHNYTDYGARDLINNFELSKGFAASGRDSILIAPLSRGNCTDFEQSLVDTPEHFKAFIDHVTAVIKGAGLAKNATLGPLAITAHSGAYRTVAKIIDSGVYADNLNELYLFDSTYGNSETFAKYAQDPEHHLWSIYHPGEAEESGSGDIQQLLKTAKVPFYQGKLTTAVNPQSLQTNRVGFVVSGGDHDTTFTKYFPLVLRDSD